jgi:peptidoglycan biosynthesis protein MviN/MurJ (putative lipid II flippase)
MIMKTTQAKTVLSVMLIMLTGKAAGLVRQILIGGRYGTGSVESEALGYAVLFPSMFLDVFFASAFTASFIPVFSGFLEKKGKKAAFGLANAFITLTFRSSCAPRSPWRVRARCPPTFTRWRRRSSARCCP